MVHKHSQIEKNRGVADQRQYCDLADDGCEADGTRTLSAWTNTAVFDKRRRKTVCMKQRIRKHDDHLVFEHACHVQLQSSIATATVLPTSIYYLQVVTKLS